VPEKSAWIEIITEKIEKPITIPEGMTLSAGLTHYQKIKECQTESLAFLRPAEPAPETGHFCIIMTN